MKRTLLVALGLIVVGCAEPEPNPRNVDELITQGLPEIGDGLYLDRETLKPYSGPVFKLFPDDSSKLAGRFTLNEGRFDGPFEQYWESGQLWWKGNRKDDANSSFVILDGSDEYYHYNGQLGQKRMFKDGELHGPWETYGENGELEIKGTYNMGELCGDLLMMSVTFPHDPCPPDLEGGR